jgi:hypothetical protein
MIERPRQIVLLDFAMTAISFSSVVIVARGTRARKALYAIVARAISARLAHASAEMGSQAEGLGHTHEDRSLARVMLRIRDQRQLCWLPVVFKIRQEQIGILAGTPGVGPGQTVILVAPRPIAPGACTGSRLWLGGGFVSRWRLG